MENLATILAAIGAFIAGLLTAGATAYIMVKEKLAKLSREDRESSAKVEQEEATLHRVDRDQTILQYKEIADRQEKHIARLDEQVQRLQRGMNRQYELLAECRASEARMFGYVQIIHGQATRHAEELCSMGRSVEVPDPLPEWPKRVSIMEEFEVRTAAQDSVLLEKVSENLKGQVGSSGEKPK